MRVLKLQCTLFLRIDGECSELVDPDEGTETRSRRLALITLTSSELVDPDEGTETTVTNCRPPRRRCSELVDPDEGTETWASRARIAARTVLS